MAYNKSEIMKSAWKKAAAMAVAASERHGRVRVGLKWKNGVINAGVHRKACEFIAVSMRSAWDQAKTAAKDAAEAEANQRTEVMEAPSSTPSYRQIVALEYAEMHGLNHGKSWVCTEYHVEARGVNPALEGEMICYAYGA